MPEAVWWKRGIVYQIYPRSFQDCNGDGVGDLKGIHSRLDYLRWLGVDAVWLSPIYPSPMADFGYDVADYCGIHPLFGTLDDFDALIADLHARGLKLILDFVPNHSSDQHPWFLESRSSRSNPKRDWYIWRDPKPDGSPPNNWLSQFGGSAWEYDEASGQYYYHAFLKEQPDLNWRNPEVRAAMHDVLRFWLRRGVDGFRVDVIWHMIKDAEFRDNPPNPAWHEGMPETARLLQTHSTDQPHVHDVIRGLRRVLEEFDDRVLIGEIYLPIERLVTYYGENLEGAQLPFNFQLILASWRADVIAGLITEYEAALPDGGWPNWVLGNHDNPRIASRVGVEQARVAAMLLLTLRGTPTLYYGDEIGLRNVEIPPDAVQDPAEKNEPGIGAGRDPERTPMQWNAEPNADFTTGRPWLPLSPDFAIHNVDALRQDETSILMLHRSLIELRGRFRALSIGSFRLLDQKRNVLAYERAHGNERIVVVLNMGHEAEQADLAELGSGGTLLLSTTGQGAGRVLSGPLSLAPDEGVIVKLG
ncbi:alpha-amylase family glycosyl hydrolase [Consotaella aegiceratis]|uniref:alpha-amylase family glycosyl hydrolase n=1 Tax=Consotaella aegiceratis TaxID=3097961 RepID=UPI002F41C2BE